MYTIQPDPGREITQHDPCKEITQQDPNFYHGKSLDEKVEGARGVSSLYVSPIPLSRQASF